jgi:N-acetylglutamate synthase-like GNAT family acetyltransferase
MENNRQGIRIRTAVPEDAPAIASVLHEAFIEYKSLYTLEGFAATVLASAQLQHRIEEGPVWVVLHHDAIVGTVSVVAKEEGLYVRGMAVLPKSRGHGIGELLLRQIESFASEQGFKRIFLSTTPFLNRAIQLYEHYGFKRIDEGPDNLCGTPLFTMEKILEA